MVKVVPTLLMSSFQCRSRIEGWARSPTRGSATSVFLMSVMCNALNTSHFLTFRSKLLAFFCNALNSSSSCQTTSPPEQVHWAHGMRWHSAIFRWTADTKSQQLLRLVSSRRRNLISMVARMSRCSATARPRRCGHRCQRSRTSPRALALASSAASSVSSWLRVAMFSSQLSV